MHSRRRRGPRGDISADLLLSAAERVLGAGGLAALSLRAVAQEAGVTPTAVYTYFSDMADLRHRLADRFLGTLDLDLLTASPPAAALRAFLQHVLEVFGHAPGQVQILASQRVVGPDALRLNEALLNFFIDRVGHRPPEAAAATDLVTEWVHGSLLLSTSNLPLTGDVSLAGYPRTAAMLTGAETTTEAETGTGTETWIRTEAETGTSPGAEMSAKPVAQSAPDSAGRLAGRAAVTALDLVVRAVTTGRD